MTVEEFRKLDKITDKVMHLTHQMAIFIIVLCKKLAKNNLLLFCCILKLVLC